jgi:hypothetical protein
VLHAASVAMGLGTIRSLKNCVRCGYVDYVEPET